MMHWPFCNQQLVDRQLDMVESRKIKLNVGVGDEVSMEHAFQVRGRCIKEQYELEVHLRTKLITFETRHPL
jgi:hypothetical protein